MAIVNYKLKPITISEKQLQLFIINLSNAKSNLQKAKDQIPYDVGNVILHNRLSIVRQILDGMFDDLNYFIYNSESQLSGI